MTQTKTCPACKKEIPVQAVRCKHCRIRISMAPPEPAANQPAPAPPAAVTPNGSGQKASFAPPPPPPPKRTSLTPPKVSPGNLPEKKGALPAPPLSDSSPKTPLEPKAVPAPKPSGKAKKTKEQRSGLRPSSLVKNKSSAFSSKKSKEALPAPVLGGKGDEGIPPLKQGDGAEIDSSRDSSQDVEGAVSAATAEMATGEMAPSSSDKEHRDSTQEILADVEKTQEISLDEISEVFQGGGGTPVVADAGVDDEELTTRDGASIGSKVAPVVSKTKDAIAGTLNGVKVRVSKAPDAVKGGLKKIKIPAGVSELLGRPMVAEGGISTLEAKGSPPAVTNFLKRLRIYHGLAALAVILFLVIVVSVAGSDEDSTGEADSSYVAAAETEPADVAEEKPDTGTSEVQPVENTCKPLADYPNFPWKEHIEALAGAAGGSTICDIFTLQPENLASELSTLTHLGPTGYDLLPKGKLVKVYPSEKKGRIAPSISYIFVNHDLYEVKIEYQGLFKNELPLTLFRAAFRDSFEKLEGAKDQKRFRFDDGDLVVERTHRKDAFKREFNTVSFANRALLDSFGDENRERLKAENYVNKGVSLLGQKKYAEAVNTFKAARKVVNEFGYSYTWQGIALLQGEKFEEVADLAEKARERSRDDRAKAEAAGLLAVVALYEGNKDEALEYFEEAKKLDPTNQEFADSVSELESGEYTPARLAKTAARMQCLDEHKGEWTRKGLLARGNFHSNATYKKALKASKNDSEFKKELERWVAWVCS